MSQPLARVAAQPELVPRGLHVAIIMDGNGRWAVRQGWPRTVGHAAGVEAVRRTVEGAAGIGIGTLTLYAFSSDNWLRPQVEVRALMRLLQKYLEGEVRRCAENGIRIAVIGRRDRLAPHLVRAIREAEARTAGCDRFLLRLAVDYSARDAILRAATRLAERLAAGAGGTGDWGAEDASREELARLLAETPNDAAEAPDVDLLIRTGGEKRLSDFLLWECAYAELWFSEEMWPDFGADDLRAAVEDFGRRQRRYGKVG